MRNIIVKGVIYFSMIVYFFSNQSMAGECTKYNQIDLNTGDYDSNNIYDITVSVSDGHDTVSQDVGVVVLNVSD